MNQFFIGFSEINGDNITLTGDEAAHISNVLRLRTGEEIQCVCIYDRLTYTCAIETVDKNAVVCRITDIQRDSTELPVEVTLYQGMPKGDKLEFIIQKAVEMGVHDIVPTQMQRSVVKIDPKKEENKLKRWNAIAKSAAEQSKRKMIPEVREVESFEKALVKATSTLDMVLVPYELAEGMDETRRILNSIERRIEDKRKAVRDGYCGDETFRIGIFIGPEGGFAEPEIEAVKQSSACVITLGRRILRTETAPIAILAWLAYVLE